MSLEILTKEDLQIFRTQLLEDIKHILNHHPENQKPWLRSIEVRKLLQISAGTLQALRVNGTLKYTRVGSIMYYRFEDIKNMIETNNTGRDTGILIHPHPDKSPNLK